MILSTAKDAADLFAPFFAGLASEKLAVAHLDARRRLIGSAEFAQAARGHVDLPIRRILEDALRLEGRGLILAHNHPSGDPRPSRQDIEATRELADTAARLGIKLHDHLILAGGGFRSLRALGLL